jgi:hypothetical protein
LSLRLAGRSVPPYRDQPPAVVRTKPCVRWFGGEQPPLCFTCRKQTAEPDRPDQSWDLHGPILSLRPSSDRGSLGQIAGRIRRSLLGSLVHQIGSRRGWRGNSPVVSSVRMKLLNRRDKDVGGWRPHPAMSVQGGLRVPRACRFHGSITGETMVPRVMIFDENHLAGERLGAYAPHGEP